MSNPEGSPATVKELAAELKRCKEEIDHLHDTFEARAVNSRRVKSLRGDVFAIPVDAEHKATWFPNVPFYTLTKGANPHMRAFHCAWFGFFTTFFSTFAAAPLATTLQQENTLALTNEEISLGNTFSVAVTIIFRVLMGFICDIVGARKGLAYLLLLTCPGIIGIMFVQNAAGFIAMRAIIGCGLASFVACQVWCTQQFSNKVVGAANATAGGWGNLGGGITNLVMVPIFDAFMLATDGNEDTAWRLSYIVPLVLHVLGAMACLSGRDLPDGNFKELELSGAKQKSKSSVITKVGLSNMNAWVLTITYGFCFGVELTMNNIAAKYFMTYFALDRTIAGPLASVFGLVNIIARTWGGLTSDFANKHWGMRGRIWALWIIQTIQGVICVFMGHITTQYEAPWPTVDATLTGWTKLGGAWTPFNDTEIMALGKTAASYKIMHCGAKQIQISKAMKAAAPRWASVKNVVLQEPPAPYGNGDNCISNLSGGIVPVVLVMFLFSVAVQMAEGATFGIVPKVSRPALGVVNGMVGAGGNLGSVICLQCFFKGHSIRTDIGIVNMGYLTIGLTLLCFLVHFPDMGGMIFGPGKIKYDPQFIKPPAGYKGADEMNFAAAAEKAAETESVDVAISAA